MRCLVTGAAGFIGSQIAEALIDLGHDVIGVDRFADYYPRPMKERNLARLRDEPRFTLAELDLSSADLGPLLEGTAYVFHQAAQAGVRASWGQSFEVYLRDNVLATQRLLEAARGRADVKKLICASSSSVYGHGGGAAPATEASPTAPFSPYGVTKLAAEHLCELYRKNFGLPTVSLRYFTVYGPRQRPDMAFHRFIAAALRGEAITLFGDGSQSRDFTFVSDAVAANLLAMKEGALGVLNVGGDHRATINEVLALVAELAGPTRVERRPVEAGDVHDTWADIGAARAVLGYAPRVSLRDGLAAQVAWHRQVA